MTCLYSSGLVGMAYIESFLPLLDSEPILPFLLSDYDIISDYTSKFSNFVAHAIRKNDGNHVIIKGTGKGELIGRYPKEYLIVRSLNHPNIGKFQELRESNYKFYMIGDYYSGGEIYDYISKLDYKSEGIALSKFKDFARQITNALDYCHHRGIIHADIKLENLVLENNNVFLIDFGFATTQEPGKMIYSYRGTQLYASPELYGNNLHDGVKSDIWSLGVTFYLLYFGEFPFYGDKLYRLIHNIKYKEPDFPSTSINLDLQCVDLIKSMLNKEPSKRLNLNKIIEILQ